MQKERFFKKSYVLVPALFAFLLIAWVIHFLKLPVEYELYKKVEVNNLVTLYVTQASAGAMTSFSYHYYLYDAKKSQVEFMDHVNDESPFMITSDSNKTISPLVNRTDIIDHHLWRTLFFSSRFRVIRLLR